MKNLRQQQFQVLALQIAGVLARDVVQSSRGDGDHLLVRLMSGPDALDGEAVDVLEQGGDVPGALRHVETDDLIAGAVFALRPSFVMPSLIARTAEVEKALSLRQWGVPFDALASIFGRDALFWYRA